MPTRTFSLEWVLFNPSSHLWQLIRKSRADRRIHRGMDEVGSYEDIDDPESRKKLNDALEKLQKSSLRSKRSKKKSDEKGENREDQAKSGSPKSSKQPSIRTAREIASSRTARERRSRTP
ncbi:hypothetical protein GCK32_008943, partial [Trichostrongylus colubriformis]